MPTIFSVVSSEQQKAKAIFSQIDHRMGPQAIPDSFTSVESAHCIIARYGQPNPQRANAEQCYCQIDGALHHSATIEAHQPALDDSDIVIASYLQHGLDCCRHLQGPFAFIVWDAGQQRLLCARDRFGQRPLYYAQSQQGDLLVSSSPQVILSSGQIRPQINTEAVSQYLYLRYVPENMTIYKNIHSIPPGCMLVWEKNNFTIIPYWDFPDAGQANLSLKDAAEEFKGLFEQAVHRCIQKKQHYGLALSGGLDSTTIAVAAAPHIPLRGFCLGVGGERNELPFARAVAEQCAIPLEEYTDEGVDVPALIHRLARVYGEPFADTSALFTWLLHEKISSQSQILLGGDGADELLGGYSYWYNSLAQLQLQAPSGDRSWSDLAQRHWEQIKYFSNEEIAAFALPAVVPPKLTATRNNMLDALQLDIRYSFPAGGIKKLYAPAQHYGLELKLPFLDESLTDFIFSLPWQYKVNANQTKIVLREAFSASWPQSILHRPKQGFGYSASVWLSRPDMVPLLHYYLGSPKRKIAELLPASHIKTYINANNNKTWLLFILAVWLETNVWEI